MEASDLSQQLARSSREHAAMLRAVLGPLQDFKYLAPNFEAIAMPNWATLRIPIEELNAAFRLPQLDEWKYLTIEAPRAPMLPLDQSLQSSIETVMEQMKTPWLDIKHTIDSARGLAKMKILGSALERQAPFTEALTEQLRGSLGDWRDVLTDTSGLGGDIEARTRVYEERGLDSSLTNFPAPAFDQATLLTRIQRPPPPRVVLYEYEIPARDPQEAAGFERTNKGQDRLQRFETRMREFIETHLGRKYGPAWIQQRVPQNIIDQWNEKAAKAMQNDNRTRPLIAFSDFTDYERIICKRDNWREVFAPFFGRPESVRESFNRLHPVRLAAMHARIITQDDQLFLYAETTRLLKAMGVI